MRGSFSPAGDLVQSLGNAAEAQGRAVDAKRRLAETERIVAVAEELKQMNAANLAEKQALRVALEQIAPNHPLLTNKMLREKIQAAGQRAMALTDDWDAVRDAGGSFQYDSN